MKPVCFIICFTLGVSLMVFSGYLPHAASARSTAPGPGTVPGVGSASESPFTGTVTRRVLDPRTDDGPREGEPEYVEVMGAGDSQEQAGPAGDPGDAASEAVSERIEAQPPPVMDPDAEATPPASQKAVAEDRAPTAYAGLSRVVWIGWNELILDGSGSVGEGLSYQWRQTAGPVSLTIKGDRQAVTTATGLLMDQQSGVRPSTYVFELTVTDASGHQDVDTVEYVVKSAPSLKIKPTAERHFELRDGYQLAHFVSWVTNLETYESAFEISSETELTFTKVRGGAYDLSGGKTGGGYVYQVVVYGQVGEPTSWVELLVDTPEKVPGVVQLGVNWEER
jgi:hypothetical protein